MWRCPCIHFHMQLQTKYEDEQARCISLTVQLDDMRKRAEGAEAQVTKLRGLPDQVAALQVRPTG